MNNPSTGASVSLSTFGGLSTELSPADIPEGGSPDNQDVAFVPGSVLTRPGLTKVETLPDGARVVYHDTFTRLGGDVFNVYLGANGQLWGENFTLGPTTMTQIATVPAGSRCKSVAAYGKLFMAFNDGLRGTDLTRAFDGETWNRVSQGGPCGNASFGEYIGASAALGNGATTSSGTIVSLVSTDRSTYITSVWVWDGTPLGSREPGSGWMPGAGHWEDSLTVTWDSILITLTDVTGLSVGKSINITGNTAIAAASNLLITALDATAKTITVRNNDTSQNYAGTGGTIDTLAPTLARSNNVVTASTATAHGLSAGDMLNVSGVTNTAIGGTVASAVRQNNVNTITTTYPNGVRAGSRAVVAGVGSDFDGTWDVTQVISPIAFQCSTSNLPDASVSGAGTVYDQWNNTQRFVREVLSATSFTYVEVGPDDSTTNTGTITPVGQIAGGVRHAVCLFQTNYGFITPPSQPVEVSTSGGKKLTVQDIPVGPTNVVARIIAFTGIDGGNYFYVPVPARSNGSAISTSTVIDDNTTTSAIFDFSDETLLSGSAIDIDGNNLFRLRVLGNCAGVGFYADRLCYWGDENNVLNFNNMGFEGGTALDGTPLGWSLTGTGLSVVTVADFGDGVEFSVGSTAVLAQAAVRDYYGATIVEAHTWYRFQCWTGGGDGTIHARFYDPDAAAVLASVDLAVPSAAGFVAGNFDVKTPLNVPSRTVLQVWVSGHTAAVTVDEFALIYADKPYNDTTIWASYVINPESIDGATGQLKASTDQNPVMDVGIVRGDLVFVTRDDKADRGRLHATTKLDGTEPSGWSVTQIADKCGACTMFSMVSGQGWVSWVGRDGARIFDGSTPKKITQDVQQLWDGLNQSALHLIWAVNDRDNRRLYWGVPTGTATSTNAVYVLDYRYAESGAEIEERASVRISPYTGKMLVLDLSRKFSPWTVPATWGGMLATSAGIVPCFGDGSGRVYRLDPNHSQDDDYGTIPAYYVTSAFVGDQQEQQLQLGSFQHLYTFMGAVAAGVGKLKVTPLVDVLTNAWPARAPYPLTTTNKVYELPLNVSGYKSFYRFEAVPNPGSLDAVFNLSSLTVTMQPHPMAPVRGAR